jgi:hypothetical protein
VWIARVRRVPFQAERIELRLAAASDWTEVRQAKPTSGIVLGTNIRYDIQYYAAPAAFLQAEQSRGTGHGVSHRLTQLPSNLE